MWNIKKLYSRIRSDFIQNLRWETFWQQEDMADNWYAHQVGGGIIIILHCAAASGAICLMCCARGSTFAIMITLRRLRRRCYQKVG